MKWLTRSHVHVDRVACPWLITRFIDSSAEFLFAPAGRIEETARREGAITFDAPGAEFGHREGKCTFKVRGLKEFGEPTRKALIMELAPEDSKAATFGLYYLLRDMVVSVAAFGGAFLWQISPETNFLAAFAFGLPGTLWFAFRGTDLTATRVRPGRAD